MVLDESALEAMLARQRAAERNHEQAPAVRTVQTDEFEVYERPSAHEPTQDPVAPAEADHVEGPNRIAPTHPPADTWPAPSAAQAPVPPADPAPEATADPSPNPASVPAGPPAAPASRPSRARFPAAPPPGATAADTDFEELPGRQGRPQDPSTDAGDKAPPAAPTPAPTSAPRRPQVWPPIRPGQGPAREGQEAPESPGSAPTSPDVPVTDVARSLGDAPTDQAAQAPGAMPVQPAAPARPRSHGPDAAPVERAGDGTGCRIAIVQAMFNHEITDPMADQAKARAQAAGARTTLHQVPGVFDLPLTVQHLARRKDVDAIVVIGCVVQGETKHDELITFTTAKTLQEISLATDTPIGLGIIGPGMTWQQAEARIGNGAHAVDAAVAMWRASLAA